MLRRLEKRPNVREMKRFLKVAKTTILKIFHSGYTMSNFILVISHYFIGGYLPRNKEQELWEPKLPFQCKFTISWFIFVERVKVKIQDMKLFHICLCVTWLSEIPAFTSQTYHWCFRCTSHLRLFPGMGQIQGDNKCYLTLFQVAFRVLSIFLSCTNVRNKGVFGQ